MAIGYVRPWSVPGAFLDSLTGLMFYDFSHQQYLKPPGGTIGVRSSTRIHEARNTVVSQFLQEGSTVSGDWFLWLDADATFDADTLARLMDAADARDRPVVGALAFGGDVDNMFPTLYNLGRDDEGRWTMDKELDYPRDALVKVGATGCHCILIHRSVFLLMHKHFSKLPDGRPNPYPWYPEGGTRADGHPIGEDVAWCINAQALGIPIYVHTGIRTGHVKEFILSEEAYDARPKPEPKRELRLA